MLPKIKDFVLNNKKLVVIGVAILFALILFIVLYKSLFYSSSEKANYGVRLRDLKDNEFTKAEKLEVIDKSSKEEKVEKVEINVKGRLIKVFVTFEDNATNDEIKASFNKTLEYVSDTVKGYYDISFYSTVKREEKEVHPVLGYKHKSKDTISFDEI